MLWLGKPGGRLESAHRLRKLMVGATRWLQALTVLGDVRRDPEIRGILSPNCDFIDAGFWVVLPLEQIRVLNKDL